MIPFDYKLREINLCYGLIPPGTTGRSYVAEEGDLAAIYMIFDILAFLFKRENIRVQSHIAAREDFDNIQNLVSISGPKWNHVTEMMIGQLGSPIYFSNSRDGIIYKDKSKKTMEYLSIRKPPHLARKCYGLILSGALSRSDGTKQRVMICAGNTTLSMFGIAAYLKKLSYTRSFTKDLKKQGIRRDKKWGLLLEVTNNMPPGREGLVWLPMNPGIVRTRVIRYIKEEEFHQPYIYDYEKA